MELNTEQQNELAAVEQVAANPGAIPPEERVNVITALSQRVVALCKALGTSPVEDAKKDKKKDGEPDPGVNADGEPLDDSDAGEESEDGAPGDTDPAANPDDDGDVTPRTPMAKSLEMTELADLLGRCETQLAISNEIAANATEQLALNNELIIGLPVELSKSLSATWAEGNAGLLTSVKEAVDGSLEPFNEQCVQLSKSLNVTARVAGAVNEAIAADGMTPDGETPTGEGNLVGVLAKALSGGNVEAVDDSAPADSFMPYGMSHRKAKEGLYMAVQDPDLCKKYDIDHDDFNGILGLSKSYSSWASELLKAAAEANGIDVDKADAAKTE